MSWANFKREEFACSHCGENHIKDNFVDVLQDIRTAYGMGMTVTSGYRCPHHPNEARKARPGAHATGLAADIAVSHAHAFRLAQLAFSHPDVTGVGVQQKGGGRFIHIDIAEPAEGRPRPHIWSY